MEGQAKPAESRGNGKGKKNTPYGGYYQSEVPAYDAELTETDAGTPMGEFMRRFWHPVCLSEEITDLPHPIRILGEDLVAFRDKSGRIGVLHRHCSHRGTSLEFGLVQERGLRCCYHAWHFDIDGTILDTPGEPANSRIKENVCQGAYPAFERHGLVFAYMGPPEEMPEFPLYETSLAPDTEIYPYSNYFSCNWLQLHENVADQSHVIFFHNGIGSRKLVEGMEAAAADTAFPPAWGGKPALDYRITEGGRSMIYAFTRRIGDRIWIRNNHFILPNYIEFGNVFEDLSTAKYFTRVGLVRWHVPHDDTHSTNFALRYFNDEVDPNHLGDVSKLGLEGGDFLGGQNCDRPYEERHRYPGDWDVIMSQRKIAVHAKENLGKTDEGVAMFRKICRDALHGKTPNVHTKRANGKGVDSEPLNSYCQDTVYDLPELPDAEADLAMLHEANRRATDIVLAGDDVPLENRYKVVRKQLRDLERELQKTYVP